MTEDASIPGELIWASIKDSKEELTPATRRSRSSGWWRLYAWPVAGTVALLVAGMAFSFFWYPVVHHISFWATPGDLWGTFRDAHYVIWDGEGRVYNASTSFVTFPGIAVLLAPFAWLQDALHLSASWPVYLLKPTGWYVLGPVDMLCGGALLFPLDAIARRLSFSSARRAMATTLSLVLIFPVVEIWGHPEDTLALTLGLYAFLAAYDGRWLHSAAYFALAVAFQPLILLIVPIALAYVPTRKWPTFATVTAIPTAILLLPPLFQEWGPTTYAIFKQPNFPTIDHATPWASLAPVLTRTRWVFAWKIHYSVEKHKFIYGPVRTLAGETISAGPGRTIAIILACLVGLWVARRKPPLVELLWWAAFALALRCVFESVMDPYYFVPTLVLALVVALAGGKTRFILTLAAAVVCTKTSYWHTGEWRYYLFVTVSLLATLAFSWPGGSSRTQSLPVDDEPAASLSNA
ncbi:MAG: hypothetical protein JWM55_304 [Acidimicrobiaceae bacterium]|nr:hypothetical protein [Acidimicrobiaceae bacterium]